LTAILLSGFSFAVDLNNFLSLDRFSLDSRGDLIVGKSLKLAALLISSERKSVCGEGDGGD